MPGLRPAYWIELSSFPSLFFGAGNSSYSILGHLDGIQYPVDNIFLCYVLCFCFVGQSDTMAEDIVAYVAHVFRNDIAAPTEKGIGFSRGGQKDAGPR